MRTRWILLAMTIALASAARATPPLTAYGHLPSVDLIALSPDGSKFAVAVGDEARRQIQIRTIAGEQPLQTLNVGRIKVRSLLWAGENHLLVTASQTAKLGGLTGPKREYYLVTDFDLATRKMATLLSHGVGDVDKLNTVVGTPQPRIIDGRPVAFVEGLTFPATKGVVTLFRVDLETGKTKIVATGDEDTTHFLVDAAGTIVASEEDNEVKGNAWVWTRSPGGATVYVAPPNPKDGIGLQGFGRTPGTVLLATSNDDHSGFREATIGNKTPSAPIAAMDDGEPVTDPATGRTIGVVHESATEMRYTFFAPADAALWARVLRAFPKAVVQLESWSGDRSRIVLRVEGGAFGAAFYLLDTRAAHASWLANEYVEIEPGDIGAKSAFHYAAADGTDIPAYLTLPPGVTAARGLPLVVLAHGGPGARDDPGFDWWSQALASRGYAVLQPQFRGSTGFTEKFHAAGYGEWGRKMQTDLSDGVAYLAKAGTINPKRVCIVGGSYGGYAALAGVTLQHGIYACAVSLAGPSDLRAMLDYEESMTGGAKNGTLRFWQRFMGAKSPSDPALDAISPVKFAGSVEVPVLLIHGVDDTVVQFGQSKAMAAALRRAGKSVEFVTLPGEDHWLSRSETRTAMLQATADFLGAHLPAGGGAAAAP